MWICADCLKLNNKTEIAELHQVELIIKMEKLETTDFLATANILKIAFQGLEGAW
jgi:hypothetical protein